MKYIVHAKMEADFCLPYQCCLKFQILWFPLSVSSSVGESLPPNVEVILGLNTRLLNKPTSVDTAGYP